MIPAVALGAPENVAGFVKKAEARFSGIDVAVGFFAKHDALLARARVHFAQLDGLLPTLRRIVRKCPAVWIPVETRAALELHFDGRSLHFDALAALHFENNGLGLRQHFTGQRIDDGVFLRAKLAGRNELKIAE